MRELLGAFGFFSACDAPVYRCASALVARHILVHVRQGRFL